MRAHHDNLDSKRILHADMYIIQLKSKMKKYLFNIKKKKNIVQREYVLSILMAKHETLRPFNKKNKTKIGVLTFL